MYKATVLLVLRSPLGGRCVVYIDSCTISQPSPPLARPGSGCTVTCEPCTNGSCVCEPGLYTVLLHSVVCVCVCLVCLRSCDLYKSPFSPFLGARSQRGGRRGSGGDGAGVSSVSLCQRRAGGREPSAAPAAPGSSWEGGIGTGALLLLPAPSTLPAQQKEEAIPTAGPLLPSWCVLP